MSINRQLSQLYQVHWDELIRNGERLDPAIQTNPMLLWFDEPRFSLATKRILICGQETWGWDGFGTSIAEGMETYRRFFIEENFYPGYGQSSFWKAFRYFKTAFCNIYGEQNCTFIYQNLSKMGRNDGPTGVTSEIRQLERKFFPVLRDEVNILKPDIVLFLTGPRYFRRRPRQRAGSELELGFRPQMINHSNLFGHETLFQNSRCIVLAKSQEACGSVGCFDGSGCRGHACDH